METLSERGKEIRLPGVLPAKLRGQDVGDEGDLEGGWYNVKEKGREDEIDGPALWSV